MIFALKNICVIFFLFTICGADMGFASDPKLNITDLDDKNGYVHVNYTNAINATHTDAINENNKIEGVIIKRNLSGDHEITQNNSNTYDSNEVGLSLDSSDDENNTANNQNTFTHKISTHATENNNSVSDASCSAKKTKDDCIFFCVAAFTGLTLYYLITQLPMMRH